MRDAKAQRGEDKAERKDAMAEKRAAPDRATLAAMAPDAKEALAKLRPGGKPPPRRTLAGEPMCEINVRLKVVTPILGGGPKLRQLDDVDIIRVPTVRGHLRFWWRALYGHLYEDAAALYAAESALWGRPADNGGGGRSEVELAIELNSVQRRLDERDPRDEPVDGAYALWTAGSQQDGTPRAVRRAPGTVFTLSIRGPAQTNAPSGRLSGEEVLRNTVRAWALFGGYGSRTRRGLGSLTVDSDDAVWLPPSGLEDARGLRDALAGLFGTDLFALAPACPSMEAPVLGRASLFLGAEQPATANRPDGGAWTTALAWLRDFRQGMSTAARQRPAAGAPDRQRPSISNWPEADVWRAIQGGTYSHASRYVGQRAYPRAGFGLPIQTRFQRQARGGGALREPGNFTLYWHDGHNERDRFGSALIVKALPLTGNMFAPCALWLTRAYPANAKVVARGTTVAQTGAPFDANYIAHPGAPEFVRTAGVDGLREAFTNWLYYDAPAQLRQTIRAIST